MTSKLPPELAATGWCFERLAVIDDPEPRTGPVNMAIDELLLGATRDGLPRLRFYRWMEPTVSFGYFEPVDAARRLAGGRPVVRRPTGGGLVEHGDDLTFTLVVPRSEPFVRLRPAESYRAIHSTAALALARGGWASAAYLKAVETSPAALGNACFQRPVLYDLIADGRKIAGGAQRRTRAGLLHQGSVRIAGSGDTIWTDGLRNYLPGLLARSRDDLHLTGGELASAEQLADAKYATPDWTDRL